MEYLSIHFFNCKKIASKVEKSFFAFIIFGLVFGLWTLSGCRSVTPWPETEFPIVSGFDTLSFSAEDIRDDTTLKTMANREFFRAVPFELWEEISEFADTTESKVYPKGCISIDARYDAYWVEIRYVWFIQQSLWIYDKHRKRFTDRATVASWYGGDGGQVRVAARLWRSGNTLQILERTQERSLQFEEEAIQSSYTEDVARWAFKSGEFYPLVVADSAYWIRKFPIQRMD